MSGIKRWLGQDLNALLLAGGVALAAWPFLFGDPYSLRLLTTAGIYALAAIGYQFVFGHAGALSLAQGAFFGIGAYVAGILSVRLGAGLEFTFPAAILAAMTLAAVVALPVLRLQSHYFALATLGIGQVVLLIAVNWESVTGGANGIPGVPLATLFGFTIARGWPMLLLVWSLVVLGALLARRLTGGLTGPALTLMREEPMAAEASGIDIRKLRFAAFLLSALFGGAAGALQVHTLRVVSPEVLEFPVMVTLLAIVVIGGRTSIAGAILGAFLLVHLPEWFRWLEQYYLLAYGAVLLAMIVAAPWGIMGALQRLRRKIIPVDRTPPPAPRAQPYEIPARELAVDNLCRHFGGVRAVDGISLTVGPGEAVGLVGANGSGKTTLLNLIAGAELPDSGSILYSGAQIAGLQPHRVAHAGIARTFQASKLADGMNVLDNVAAAAWRETGGLQLGPARGRAMVLLAKLGLAEFSRQECNALPPGLRRRVEIARALMLRPSLLLLDEPAAGLTGAERESLAGLLTEIRSYGASMLVVEHDLGFLERFADRLVCLDQGQVIADGTPSTVRVDPQVVSAWIGAPLETGGSDG